MKKTILVMTTLVLTCVALLIGCEVDGNTEDEPSSTGINPSSITTEFQTFYIKVLDQNRTAAPDISTGARWHFHNNVNNGDTIGFAIQKVFVNDSPSETGAVVLYDFTEAPDFSSANKGAFDTGSMSAGSVSGGAWVVERTDSGYTYLGNLASSAEAGGKAYWGFVVKNVSTTAKADNVNLEIVNADSVSVANSSLAGWFGIKDFGAYADPGEPSDPDDPDPVEPVLTSEFAVYYLNIADAGLAGIEGIHFHNKTDHELGMVVDRIYATNTPGIEEAIIQRFDGTDKSTEEDTANGGYYWTNFNGTDGSVTIGVAAGEGNYAYIGGFATPLFTDKAYIGIVAKNVSDTVKGDEITVQPIIGGGPDDSKSKTFAGLFSPYTQPESQPVLTSEFAVYYLNIADAGLAGIEGIHFHNKTDHELGMVVDRIYATNTPGIEEAIIQRFDGTDKSTEEDAANGGYYWTNFNGTDGSVTIGVAAGEGNYAYIGGFATPLFTDKAYIGIVAKNVSDTVKGDEITVQPIIGSAPDDSKSKTFAELFCE